MSTSEALVDIIRKFIIAEDEMHQYDYNAQFLVGAFPHITRIRSSHLFAFFRNEHVVVISSQIFIWRGVIIRAV